jgi:hypothetical protein
MRRAGLFLLELELVNRFAVEDEREYGRRGSGRERAEEEKIEGAIHVLTKQVVHQ